jgi:predicted dehydrogenase
LFDVFRHLAGEIRHVFATTAVLEPERFTRDSAGQVVRQVDCDAEDAVWATFETETGVIGQVQLGWAGHGGPTRIGEGRGLVYHTTAARVADGKVTFDDGRTERLQSLYETGCPPERREREFPRGLTDAFALNQLDWLSAVREGRPPETNGREGLADMAAAFAVLESAALGRRVDVG